MIRYARLVTPLGTLIATAVGGALTGLYYEGRPHAPAIGADAEGYMPALLLVSAGSPFVAGTGCGSTVATLMSPRAVGIPVGRDSSLTGFVMLPLSGAMPTVPSELSVMPVSEASDVFDRRMPSMRGLFSTASNRAPLRCIRA